MMPRKPDYSSAGLMLQMQRDADLRAAKRCSTAVSVLVVLVVLVALVPGLGLILGGAMMLLLMVVASALSVVTIVKGRLVRGLLDLLAVWIVVPLVVVVLQLAGLTWLARQAEDVRRAAAVEYQQRQKLLAQTAPAATLAKPAPQPAPLPAPEDPRLWALREKVVAHYQAQGMAVQESVRARFVTVKLSSIHGASLKNYQLENLAAEGVKIWRAEDEGFFTVLITDTTGNYLASADPGGTKTLR